MFGWKKKKRRSVVLEKEKVEQRKQNNPKGLSWVFRLVYFQLVLAFFGVVVYVVFFSQLLVVEKIEVVGNEEIPTENILETLEIGSRGDYWLGISKKNYVLFSKNKIEKILLENFKKIRSVEVEKKFPSFVSIKIDERKALIVWCSGGRRYVIDDRGYTYMEADFSSQEIAENNLIKISDESNTQISLGERVFEEKYADFMISLRDLFENEIGIKITNEYSTKSRVSDEVRVKSENGFVIYVNTQIPINGTMRTLKTFFSKEINGDKIKDLEYVDARIENKVFYRFRSVDESGDGDASEVDDSESQSQ